jgi:hypothetical protein
MQEAPLHRSCFRNQCSALFFTPHRAPPSHAASLCPPYTHTLSHKPRPSTTTCVPDARLHHSCLFTACNTSPSSPPNKHPRKVCPCYMPPSPPCLTGATTLSQTTPQHPPMSPLSCSRLCVLPSAWQAANRAPPPGVKLQSAAVNPTTSRLHWRNGDQARP